MKEEEISMHQRSRNEKNPDQIRSLDLLSFFGFFVFVFSVKAYVDCPPDIIVNVSSDFQPDKI